MIEKRYEIRANKDGSYWLFDNKYDSVLIISKIGADLINICTVLNEQQAEIERLKKELEPKFEDNQETEVRECQFCGEFRTEYHEYEDYSWSAEDYCNAGHDLEDTDPNSCKDYWDDD